MNEKTVVNLLIVFVFVNAVYGHFHLELDLPNQALNQSLFEDVLDSKECRRQVNFLRNNTLLLSLFLDAGIRTPRGVLAGNTIDLGNYHQCLGIAVPFDDTAVEGKYCMIRVPFNQELQLPILTESWTNFDPSLLRMDEDVITKLKDYNVRLTGLRALFGADLNGIRSGHYNPLESSVFRLGVCIPKPCTTEEAISALLFNVTSIGFHYDDDFCRLPNDKPWVPADYIAIGVFSFIGLLSLLSTWYELNHIVVQKKDAKTANEIYSMFSVFTNTNRLLTFTPGSSSLECLDGVRALAMIWVLLEHSFSTQPFTYNPLDSFQWMISLEGLWITAGHITVDTFFMLSGLLVVYTTVGKMTAVGLLKNIHFFYLNRLLRMFPVLATVALLEASIFNHISDGPVWSTVISQAHRCRTYWWSTLLHIQNYVNSMNVCIGATWYLAIDVQLHILSPIVLVWLLCGNKQIAWTALTGGVILSITVATIYNFVNVFPTGMVTAGEDMYYYMVYYYMNTLTRAPPFLVGMIYGYLLHIWRGKRVQISTIINLVLWVLSLSFLALALYCIYPTMQTDWNNQTVDSLINSFMRPAWALGLGWVIFACVHGYGGPINWVLSLRLWKLPARLSYAMYILHYSLMVIVNSSSIAPIYFTVPFIIFLFCGYFMLTIIAAFIVTVFIDMPFSRLFKLFLDKVRTSSQAVADRDLRNGNHLVKGSYKNGLNNNGFPLGEHQFK